MSRDSEESEGVHALIRGLEETLCERLDHIDASLRNLRRIAEDKVKSPRGSLARDESMLCTLSSEDAVWQWQSDRKLTAGSARGPPSMKPSEGPLGVACECLSTSSMGEAGGQERDSCVSLRSEWQQWLDKGIDQATVVLVNRRLGGQKHAAHGLDDPASLPPWYILQPKRPFRLLWDLVASILIAHDMAVVPVNMAFGIDGNIVSNVLFWPSLIFWTVDFALAFFTGVYKKGKLEVRVKHIALHYLRTWFLIDTLVLCSSWLELWGTLGDGYLRVLRVVRVAKLRRIAQEFHDSILSEYHHIMLTIFKLILTIIWLNHFIACGWWAIGANTHRAGFHRAWTSSFNDGSVGWQYFTSLHWSMTQFTPASMEVSATNTPERIFSVLVLFFAMVTFSSFVSSITAAMTRLRQLHGSHAASITLLRRYLRSRGLPIDLTARILHCVEYRRGQQAKEVQEHEVQYLKLLSQPLKVELSLHVSAPILKRHPFLQLFSQAGFEAMQQLCLDAVERSLLSTQDALFREGMLCKQMFFVVSGSLSYQLRMGGNPEASLNGSVDRVTLREGDHCCEMTIWSPWVHRGTMVADCMSEVMALNADAFARITSSFNTVNRLSARYGRLFLDAITRQSLEDGEEIDDITVLPSHTVDEILQRASIKQPVLLRSRSSMSLGSERVGRQSAMVHRQLASDGEGMERRSGMVPECDSESRSI